MVTKGGPHSGPPEGHPVVTKGVDPTGLNHVNARSGHWDFTIVKLSIPAS